MELKYIPEYESLKRLPTTTWSHFIVLKYDSPPQNPDMIRDVQSLFDRFGRSVKFNDRGKLVYFIRIEEVQDGVNHVPRHLHILLGKPHLSERGVYGSNLRLWSNHYGLSLMIEKWWEHGASWVEPFDPSNGDGVGYVCKRRGREETTYFSKELQKLIRKVSPDEN